MNHDVDSTAEDIKKGRGGIVLASMVTAAIIVFVAQNTADTEVTWLFFDATGPLWIVIIVAAVAGALLSELLGFLWRRHRRR